ELEAASVARSELRDEASVQAAQARYDHAWEQMNSRGYFRDSYNDSNLLRQFGLSWWHDVIPMLDEKSELSPQLADRLFELLKAREAQFDEALAEMDDNRRACFRRRYAELKEFLGEAIALKQPILCSL